MDRTNDYTLDRISNVKLCPRMDCADVFRFLDGNRNFAWPIVLKYPVVNHPQPLRRPVFHTLRPASNLYLMASKTPTAAQAVSFEDAMAELEQLVARMEAG